MSFRLAWIYRFGGLDDHFSEPADVAISTVPTLDGDPAALAILARESSLDCATLPTAPSLT
jgi:hypothetical protein